MDHRHNHSTCVDCVPCSLLRKFTEMDHILDRSDDEDNTFSENPPADSLQEAATKKWVRDRLQCYGGEERDFLSPSGKEISEGFLLVRTCKTSRACNQEGGFVSSKGCC